MIEQLKRNVIDYYGQQNHPLKRRAEEGMCIVVGMLQDTAAGDYFKQAIVHEGQFGWKYDQFKLYDYTSYTEFKNLFDTEHLHMYTVMGLYLVYNMYPMKENREYVEGLLRS